MIMKVLWVTIGGVLLSAVLAWGAWNTVLTTNAASKKDLSAHKEKDNDRFMEVLREIQEQRESIEEKLDDIQERL